MRKFILFSTYEKVLHILPEKLKRKFWWLLALIIVTSIVDIAGLALFIPIISAVAEPELLNKGLLGSISGFFPANNPDSFLFQLFLVGFVFMVFRTLFVVYSQRVQSKFGFQIAEYIGQKTFHYYLHAELETISKLDSSKIIRELTQSPQHFARFLVLPILLITAELVVVLFIVTGIALYNIEVLLLIACTIFPVVFLFQLMVKRKLRAYGQQQHEFTPELYSNSNRGIFGLIDVRLRNKTNLLIQEYRQVLAKLNIINIKTNVLAIVPAKLFELVTILGLLVIFVYGTYISKNTTQILPLITIYAAAGYRLIPSLTKIMPSLMQLEQYSYLFKVFQDPLTRNQDPEVGNDELQVPVLFNEEIKLENISFVYKKSNHRVLDNISLNIKKGEIIGLIGKSGSGKSTLVNLLIGFYKPDSGKISIDGQPLNQNQWRGWMNQISYVQQSPYLEKGNLASNIAFLETEIDRERLNRAIEGASLSSFVKNKDPFELEIDELGKNLSGGQKQRVIIARALYHNSSVIILDEATSALDNETEDEINQTIHRLKGTGITIIVIAHRFSTLRHTDRIYRMDAGKVVDSLQYESLK
ncbi:ABC transporter ATP-binding protein [Flavihumibacter sp. UBA7668]|uniref:ABC transporter ATP-binding protein n=1 Tax=Flavihumibacter sp. UBA7668 TaxID=1946542 RepID=UPI0025BD1F00|nr:ATP-binding cassette domain-containing protein [Flavihumibacter sp. UBA7668]